MQHADIYFSPLPANTVDYPHVLHHIGCYWVLMK